MTTGNPFKVGVSGLQVFQRTLNTIGHNISNSQTEGYSRQRVEIATRNPSPGGAGFVGNGVYSQNIIRLFDQNAIDQVRSRTSSTEYFSVYHEFASQVDNLVADPDAGLSPAIEAFFDSVQEVADDPASIPAREVMLTEGEALVDRFITMQDWFSDLQDAVNDHITTQISVVNRLSSSIAEINQQIVTAKGFSRGQPNDLLDKRDVLMDELAQHVNLSILEQDNGTVNVYVASGQSLVLGTDYMSLVARPNPDDPVNKEVGYIDPTKGTVTPISDTLQGGDLGGILDFRKEILIPAITSLGRLSVSIASTFNAQHQKGMDLNNNMNNDFFVVPEMKGTAGTSNTGLATGVSIALSDVAALTTDEYQLSYDGTNYVLRNPLTNQVFTPGIAAVTPPDTTLNTFNGMDITIEGGTPDIGDVFYIRPFRTSAREISLAISDPNFIAAANPLRSSFNVSNNLGDAEISQPVIIDNTNVNLREPVTITFANSGGLTSPADADQFNVVGVGTGAPVGVAYVKGDVISFNGWEVKITGVPKVGDIFTIDPNNGGFSDNRNALALADLQTTGTMTGGNASYHDAYSELVVSVGNKTSQAEISLEAQEALLAQSKEYKESISGVNLDEEAANLLRYQQAYSAAAQVITIANSMFETLLGAVRR